MKLIYFYITDVYAYFSIELIFNLHSNDWNHLTIERYDNFIINRYGFWMIIEYK